MRNLAGEEGYSLLEALVAMVILTVCIVPMVGMFDAAINASGTSANYDRARSQASRSLERIHTLEYDEAVRLYGPSSPQTCPADDPDDRFLCTMNATFVDESLDPVSGGDATRMLLDVKVEWQGGSYRASGLITAARP